MSQIRMEQISAMNISFQFYSLEYFLESVARIGFQSVDLWTGYPHMLLDQDYAAQCREIRQISRVPILFISSASDNMNIVMAMNMGADDFIAKPFDQSVLMAKIQAMLRRTYDFAGAVPVLEHKGAFLNTGENTLTYQGKQIDLTKNEYRILLALMENKGKVVSRERLMERLWETDSFIDENTLTVNVNRLRKKLDAAGLTNFIATKFGVGYLIA